MIELEFKTNMNDFNVDIVTNIDNTNITIATFNIFTSTLNQSIQLCYTTNIKLLGGKYCGSHDYELINNSRFNGEISIKTIDKLMDYFRIKYPKIDCIYSYNPNTVYLLDKENTNNILAKVILNTREIFWMGGINSEPEIFESTKYNTHEYINIFDWFRVKHNITKFKSTSLEFEWDSKLELYIKKDRKCLRK